MWKSSDWFLFRVFDLGLVCFYKCVSRETLLKLLYCVVSAIRKIDRVKVI